MCGESGTVVKDLCFLREHHENPRTSTPSTSVEKVWKETQQLMEQSEHLVRVMTHVCSQQLSGVFRSVAKYSQGTVNARPFVKSVSRGYYSLVAVFISSSRFERIVCLTSILY